MKKDYGQYEKDYYEDDDYYEDEYYIKEEKEEEEEYEKMFKKGKANEKADALFKEYSKYPRCPVEPSKQDSGYLQKIKKLECPKHTKCPGKSKYPDNLNEPICEKIKLAKREIRNEIFFKYETFAFKLANKYTHDKRDLEDVEQKACEGLIKAIERFDLSLGFTFMTFATPVVVGEIKNYYRDLGNNGQMMKVSREIYETGGKINKARLKLEQKLQRTPTELEIAEELGIDLALIRETLCVTYTTYNPYSLDYVYTDKDGDEESSLIEKLASDDAFQNTFMVEGLINKYTKDFTDLEYDTFTRIVLDGESQQSIADEVGVNQTTIGRRVKNLKKRFVKKLIEDYTYDFTDEEYFIFNDLYVENKSLKVVAKELGKKEKEIEKIGDKLKADFFKRFLN